MARAKQRRQVDRHTTFACLSVSSHRINGKHKDEIIATLKKQGWGVLANDSRYQFIHFDENVVTDVSSILNRLDCEETGWSAYRLSFPTVDATQALVDSAEWK